MLLYYLSIFTAMGFSNIYQTKVKPTFTNERYPYVFSSEWHNEFGNFDRATEANYRGLTRIKRPKV